MRYLFLIIWSILGLYATAQQPEYKKLIMQGEYAAAEMQLEKALATAPNDLSLLKDKLFLQYLQRDFAGAIELGKKLAERTDADFQVFQQLGLTYAAIADYKEADKLYLKGIQRFPTSGVLYADYGAMLQAAGKKAEAIAQWEKGISTDPNYPANYFFAVKHYALAEDWFPVMLYGELFLNLESFSQRTTEIKNLLYESCKRIFSLSDMLQAIPATRKPTAFEKAVLGNFSRFAPMIREGVTPEVLTAIRTRFLLAWMQSDLNKQFPFELFQHLNQLLREGHFDAYHQWLFGMVASPSAYQLWINSHEAEVEKFKKYQRSNLFKIPAGQYYR